MTADDPMELTRNPVDGSWGFICREHGVLRSGLTERHALNVEAKHQREDHLTPPQELDLTEAARAVLHHGDAGSLSVWKALTGLASYEAALDYAQTIADSAVIVRAAVVPF